MVILIRSKPVVAKPIEWADRLRIKPIGWTLTCPWCDTKQWMGLKNLYVGKDGSRNNHQCKHCGAGTEPRGGWKKLTAEDVFKPKAPGWRSIDRQF